MPVVAIDTEATGLNPWGDVHRWGFAPARPFAVSMCWENGNTSYTRWMVDPRTRRVKYPPVQPRYLVRVLADSTIRKVWFNAAYDLRMLEHAGFVVRGPHEDVMMMMHILTGGSELHYALKPLALKYLGYSDEDEQALQKATIHARHQAKKQGWKIATEEAFGRQHIKADYWLAPPELCKQYALGDVERTMLLYRFAFHELRQVPTLWNVYRQELALLPVLYRMEARGLRIFPQAVTTLQRFYHAYRAKQLQIAEREGGKGLNFASPKQMTREFYVTRKYPPKLTDKGNWSLNSQALNDLATKYKDRLAKAILEHNAADHTLRSFLDPYRRFMVQESPQVWVLHPNFRQVGPITGRMSSTNPNLMNVASEDTKKHEIDIAYRQREVFGPRPGHVWYLPDYSQIEVWLFAFLSDDTQMQTMLLSGHDFHGEVARTVWGAKPDFQQNFSHYRKRGKVNFFCKLYGGGVRKVAKILECSDAEAAEFVEAFDARLPGISTFMARMMTRAERDGKIVNPFGRVYYLDRHYSYRAVNYLIQGSAADVLKRTMIRLDGLFRRRWPGAQQLLPLHDELIIEVPRRYHSKRLMREIMAEMQRDSAVVRVPRPLPVSMKLTTTSWATTTPISL